jgi:tRNA U34 2-thiouridine synthase MnmA/TrmU
VIGLPKNPLWKSALAGVVSACAHPNFCLGAPPPGARFLSFVTERLFQDGSVCPVQDARRVCERLRIPLHEADFVSRYWNAVFSGFLEQCARGLTPNPDLACNRHIKFGALRDFARGMGADVVATGHYARLARCARGMLCPA